MRQRIRDVVGVVRAELDDLDGRRRSGVVRNVGCDRVGVDPGCRVDGDVVAARVVSVDVVGREERDRVALTEASATLSRTAAPWCTTRRPPRAARRRSRRGAPHASTVFTPLSGLGHGGRSRVGSGRVGDRRGRRIRRARRDGLVLEPARPAGRSRSGAGCQACRSLPPPAPCPSRRRVRRSPAGDR